MRKRHLLKWRHGAAGVCILLLAGCIGGSQVGYPYIASGYSSSLVYDAARSGTIALDVRGKPFGAQPAGQNERIAALLGQIAWLNGARFAVIDRTKPEPPQYRLVMLFNPVELSSDGAAACRNADNVVLGATGDKIKVIAAFCDGSYEVSSAIGYVPANSLDDPKFAELMSQIVIALFPPRNPLHRDVEPQPNLLPGSN
jgi:hypothetical protein